MPEYRIDPDDLQHALFVLGEKVAVNQLIDPNWEEFRVVVGAAMAYLESRRMADA